MSGVAVQPVPAVNIGMESVSTGTPGVPDLVRAFNEIREELVGTLAAMLGNREDAHDAAQDTFIKCWKAREEMAGVLNIRAFIYRVALNTATDIKRSAWKRRSRSMPEGDITMAPLLAGPAEVTEQQEDLHRLRLAIGQLRKDEQEVFLLRQNGDLTYDEIAEMRKVPVGTIKTQMRSALMKLKELLEETE